MFTPIFSDIFDGNLFDNNTTNGTGIADNIVLDEGSDTSDGGAGDDLMYGNGGSDSLLGNAGSDNIQGGSGNDTLDGGANNDILDGGVGDDTYLFDTDLLLGTDFLIDASGIDTLNFAATTTKTINLNLGSTVAQTVTAGNLTLTLASATTFENVIGGSLGDTIVGNTLANSLTGNGGNDSLVGNAGSDNIQGGSGNDTLDGGADNDILDGGADNDTYLFDTDLLLGTDFLSDASGIDTLNFAATTTKTINLNLGSTVAQTVTAGNLTLTLASAIAFENVIGGSLSDTIVGNSLANSLTGGSGNDTLEGGLGQDTLTGGTGNDFFRLTEVSLPCPSPASRDLITDFSVADDTIILANSLDSTLVGSISPGIKGLSFSGGSMPGNVLSAGWFFKGAGLDGCAAGNLSGIYVNTINGDIWYNDSNLVGSYLIANVGAGAALAMTNADFVYGV